MLLYNGLIPPKTVNYRSLSEKVSFLLYSISNGHTVRENIIFSAALPAVWTAAETGPCSPPAQNKVPS